MSEDASGALSGLRVIELGHGIAGPFAARLLGDLGADVIKVEPPEGEFGRGIGPQLPDGSGGYLFHMLNWNKRSLELDLRDVDAAVVLRPLVQSADVVIESLRPGTLDKWGVGVETLREWNPRLVVTSVSNFGQEGPQSDWYGSDLVFYAMSGVMHMSGKKLPRYPLKHGLRQSLYGAGLSAAYASLVGYYAARHSGHGTHVDLSIRDVKASEQVTQLSYYIFTGLIAGRPPAIEDPFLGDPIDMPGGQISIQAPPACPMPRWADFLDLPELNNPVLARSVDRVEHVAALRPLVEARLAGFTAKELFLRGSREGMILALVQGAAELLSCEQLEARGFFRLLPGHEDTGVRVPVELAKLSRTPLEVRRASPRVGEHTAEILSELPRRISAGNPIIVDASLTRPLEGLRVLDLSNVVAGPYMGGLLADLGADVIKIEGPARVDPARVEWGPLIDNDGGGEAWNRGGAFQVLNRGKRSLVCDLATDEGQSILIDLIKASDILIENFTPRVLRNWGLTPERLMELNPRLITVSNSGYGASGPWQNFKAQGTTLEVMMGISAYTGYPGGRAAKVGQSYPDFISCWTGLTMLMAALIERDRSGLGQHIDQSMYQVGAALIPEALISYQLDGAEFGRIGAADFDTLFSDVIQSAEPDEWVAVTVADSSQVVSVRSLIGGTGDADLADDLRNWIGGRSPEDAATALQAVGIAAGKVLSLGDLMDDEHLLRRGFYEPVEFGPDDTRPLIGRAFRLSDFVAEVAGRAPRFGQHNREILAELGTRTTAQVDDLYARGILAETPVRPVGAVPVDVDALTGPAGGFSAVHHDYRQRLKRRAERAGSFSEWRRTHLDIEKSTRTWGSEDGRQTPEPRDLRTNGIVSSGSHDV